MTDKPQKYRDMTVPACLWLGLFPLLHGGTYSSLTLDKWRIMAVLAGLTLAWFAAQQIRSRRPLRPGLPQGLLLLLLGWMLLSSLLSPLGRKVCWLGTSARREGLAAQGIYGLLFLCFSLSSVRWRPVLCAAFGGVVLFAALSAAQILGANPFGLYPEGLSYATNPEFLSSIGNIDMSTGYLLLSAGCFLSACLSRAFSRPLRILCAGGFLVCVVLIGVMGVQFGALTLSLLLVFAVSRRLPGAWRFLLPLFLLAVFLLLLYFFPPESGGLWELREVLAGRPADSFGSNRLGVWRHTLSLCLQRPLLGGGADTFASRFTAYLSQNGLSLPAFQGTVALPVRFDTPHNEYLALWVNSGLPALLLYGALAAFALRKKRQPVAAAGVFCYMVQAFFSFSVCLLAPMFWVVFGLACSREPCPCRPLPGREP